MSPSVAASFGYDENTLTDPVVLALPGVLPVMNKRALDAIIKAGLMLGCDIAPVCKWDRKNYFYPIPRKIIRFPSMTSRSAKMVSSRSSCPALRAM